MNDKDKEALYTWIDNDILSQGEITRFRSMSEQERVIFVTERTWQAAIAYERTRLQKYVKLEKVPCDCHLFKHQVCGFCQGLIMYAHITPEDEK